MVAPLVLSGAHAHAPLGAWPAQASRPVLHDEQMMIQVQAIAQATRRGDGERGLDADAASASGDCRGVPCGGQREDELQQWGIACLVGRSMKIASLDQPQMPESFVLDEGSWSPSHCPQPFSSQVMLSNSAVSVPTPSSNRLAQVLPIVVVLASGFCKIREALVENTTGFPCWSYWNFWLASHCSAFLALLSFC